MFLLTFGFFLFPISEHMFHITAIKKLFLARTKDSNFFLKSDEELEALDEEKFPKNLKKWEKKELKKHRQANLSLYDVVMLYLARQMG